MLAMRLFQRSLFTALTLLITSYALAQKNEEQSCQFILKNEYQSITEEDFKLKLHKKKLILNEIKYQCAYSAMYTSKGMFDRFGKWDEVIFSKNKTRPLFLWENVKLFPDDTISFNVVAHGLENEKTTYASVMVFDKAYKDLLSENSDYKTKLKDNFSVVIRTNDPNQTKFYEAYWKTVNPEWWEVLQRNQAANIEEKRCPEIFKNDYKTIIQDSIKSVVDDKIVYLNEVKYECTFTSFYIKKGMYDRFGKWDEEIFLEGDRHPILLWKNVKLFSDDPTTFNVAAAGDEDMSTIYSSVFVSDVKNQDLLAKDSKYREKLITYFSNLIRSNKSNQKEYYEVYWEMVRRKQKERDRNKKSKS